MLLVALRWPPDVDLDVRFVAAVVAKVSLVAVMVPLTTICERRCSCRSHGVAGGEVQRPVVGERLASRAGRGRWPATLSVAPEATVKPPGRRKRGSSVGADLVQAQRTAGGGSRR